MAAKVTAPRTTASEAKEICPSTERGFDHGTRVRAHRDGWWWGLERVAYLEDGVGVDVPAGRGGMRSGRR